MTREILETAGAVLGYGSVFVGFSVAFLIVLGKAIDS